MALFLTIFFPQQLLNLLIRILIRDKLNPVNPD